MASTQATGKYQREHFSMSPVANPKAVVGGKDGLKYRFTVLTPRLIRYEWAADGIFEDRASSFAIRRDLPVPDFDVTDQEHSLEIVTKKFHLRYDKKKLSASGFSVLSKDGVTDWKNLWRYGGGLKQAQYQLHGTARTLDEANGRIPLGNGILSRNGYSDLDDSDSMLWEEDGNIGGRRPGDRVDGYVFMFGYDFKDAMKDFFAVSGHQPLLPRWALGNWWSRYYEYTADTYLELMDRFQKQEIPFSVGVLDMDWHWVGDKRVKDNGATGWTGYSWNTDLFPKPKEFLDELHRRGLKITPNDHPADGIAAYEEMYGEMCKAVGRDPQKGDTIPFDIANKTFRDAYFDILLRKREDDGIDFWWNDWQQGIFSSVPGADPLWVLNHFHFLNNSRDHKRPLGFSRFAGPGSHRYPVGFSGDSVVTWESLDFQPEFTATSSNIGYGWWSHDIGGHMNGYRSDELATRWVQHGVFSPILRLHSSNNPWNSKEPWRFSPESSSAMTAALRLRHRLLPYLYSMNVRSARDGEPLVQPVYWQYPKNRQAYMFKNSYFFGSELLVVPITSPRLTSVRRAKQNAWLPPGRYVDIFSGTVYDGDRVLWFYRELEDYAVFAKEGAIIPFDAAERPANGAANAEALEVKVVVGADGKFELYEDDGSGSDVDDVDWTTTPIVYDHKKGELTIGPASGHMSSIPEKRSWTVNFIALPPSIAEKITATITPSSSSPINTSPVVKPTTTPSSISLTLHSIPTTSTITISLNHASPTLTIQDPLKEVFRIIDDAQMDFDPKQAIWETVKGKDRPVRARLGVLGSMGWDEEVVRAIMEVCTADSRWEG